MHSSNIWYISQGKYRQKEQSCWQICTSQSRSSESSAFTGAILRSVAYFFKVYCIKNCVNMYCKCMHLLKPISQLINKKFKIFEGGAYSSPWHWRAELYRKSRHKFSSECPLRTAPLITHRPAKSLYATNQVALRALQPAVMCLWRR